MHNSLTAIGLMAAVAATALPAQAADDWSFIGGKYAVAPDDCKHLAKGKPFSKALVKLIDSEVLTREGITSHRETHCRFRSAARQTGGSAEWKVKAACEELGKVSQEGVAVAKNADGSLVVTSEDVFGPPLKFSLCPK